MLRRERFVAAAAPLCIAFFCALFITQSCATQKRLQKIKSENNGVSINPLDNGAKGESGISELGKSVEERRVDTLEDNSSIIMNAAYDEQTGEMVATDVLDAAVVISRRYQVAERNGKVDLPFEILVPQEVMASPWQLRIVPDMVLEGTDYSDTTQLEPVFVTGNDYREKQLKGYQQYDRFISGIITDSSRLVYKFQLEQFIRRNLPELYSFRNDSSYVSDEEFYSRYDVTSAEAIDHYTRDWVINRNEKIESRKDARFRRYVKSPIVTEGIRLDTVMVNVDGDYIYRYVQTIDTQKDLKYAYISLNGSIFDQDKEIYTMPQTDSIEYPISSLSHFVKDITRYKMKTVWRRQEANSSYNIQFALGKDKVERDLGNNAAELDRIASNLRTLMQNEEFDLDSIIVYATCSPEGSLRVNDRISRARSRSVCNYFDGFMKAYTDSVAAEKGFAVDVDGNVIHTDAPASVPFVSKYTPEDWDMLDALVESDTHLDQSQKDKYFQIADKYLHRPDAREFALRKEKFFDYIKDELYPKLRVVKFNFNLHRKGMVEEFVQTEEVDTAYARGVQLLKDRDYNAALEVLYDYDDYNTAVACMAMDRNLRALECLEKEKETADVLYLKAIIYSRFSRDKEACDCFLKACEMDKSYKFRGNLDPEVSVLIDKYKLNAE